MKLWLNLFCRDIEAQMRFYQALLGLPEAESARSPIFRAVEAPDFQVGFNAFAAYALLEVEDRMPSPGTPAPLTTYATFMVESHGDVTIATARAAGLGGRVIKMPHATYYGQWLAVLADPEGHVFRVSAHGLPNGVVAPPLPVSPLR